MQRILETWRKQNQIENIERGKAHLSTLVKNLGEQLEVQQIRINETAQYIGSRHTFEIADMLTQAKEILKWMITRSAQLCSNNTVSGDQIDFFFFKQ